MQLFYVLSYLLNEQRNEKYIYLEIAVKQKAFMMLFEPCRASLSRYARSISKNNEDAKDLISDTILSAFENLDSLKNKEAFLSYLFTTASRIHKRKIWRKRLFLEWNDNLNDSEKSYSFNPEETTDIGIAYSLLQKLNYKTREAIVLFEISGFSIEEISEIQESGISAVKSRLKRGREELKKMLIFEKKIPAKSPGTLANTSLHFAEEQRNNVLNIEVANESR